MPTDPIFVDRVDERAVLQNLVESARQGESAALVVFGDAGMGKTALIDLAVSFGGLPVARISGVEAEQSFGFAALHRLFVPFLYQMELLPPPQRIALETAFGLLGEGPPDLFMVGLAALSVLAAESSEPGMLCVVDDAQWIDVESLQTLAFVGRRLGAEGVVLLFGLRSDLDVPGALAGIPTLEVGGLSYDAAVDVLAHAAGRGIRSEVVERVVRETGGCPLALWELGKELAETPGNNGGHSVHLTITHQLEDHFFQQVTGLSVDTQLLLLVAAADTSGDRVLVSTVAREFGVGEDAWDEAEQERMLLPGREVRFRHPLIRSTVYAHAEPNERRLVHQALAQTMGKGANLDLWARHVALGAAGPSEQLATELEDMSQMAQARGGYSAQATLLVQAANLSESLATRSARLLRAAAASQRAGGDPYAAELLDQAEPHLSDPEAVAEAHHLRGRISIGLARPAEAAALLLAAARSYLPLSMNKAREVLLEAFDVYSISGRFTTDVSSDDIASVAHETEAVAGPQSLQDHLLDGTTAFFSGSRSQAYEHFRKAADLIRAGDVTDAEVAQWALFGTGVMDEIYDDSADNLWLTRTEAYARQNGVLMGLLFNLIAQMHFDTRRGQLRAAAGRHAEVLDIAAAIGLPTEIFVPMDHIVRAWAGDEEGARAATAALIEANTALGIDAAVLEAHFALAILHLGAGRYQEALTETDLICAENVIGFPALALPFALEAAFKSGQIEKARHILADLESRAVASGTPWALGLLARSRALLAATSEAEKNFQEAIGLLADTSVASDVAHARLLYGEWLRRERRRVDARAQLRMAHDYYVEIGAMGFAKRAETELLATGERARPRSIPSGESLTPQERRVAELAAEGLTNMEIGSQLFISSATVDYHLRKVYRKLDIGSRHRLGKALGTLDLTPSA